MFDPSVLFAAFKSAGMLVACVYKPATDAVPFDAGWQRPELLLQGDETQSVEYELEFETSAVPRLKRGDPLTVAGAAYIVRAAPRTQGDGYFSRVQLDKA